ncbi:porin family protein [Aquimarina atlantica]|nr:porin family protein [Aquimarina atlantica]
MKKLLLVCTCISIFGIASAQKKTSFGLRGGVNISNLSDSNLETKSGVYIGALLNIRFSELYALQPEIGYSNQGGNTKFATGSDVEIHYLSISATNKFFVKNTGLHFLIAPGIDFDVDDTPVGIVNRDEGNDVTFVDVSIAVGLGYEFKNGIGIEARYKRGTLDVFDGDFHNFSQQSIYKEKNQFNEVLQVGISYRFNF